MPKMNRQMKKHNPMCGRYRIICGAYQSGPEAVRYITEGRIKLIRFAGKDVKS